MSRYEQIEKYTNAERISFQLGIKAHYTYYRKRIMQLLQEEVDEQEELMLRKCNELLDLYQAYEIAIMRNLGLTSKNGQYYV